MYPYQHIKRGNRGFSLVEIMVGIGIALIAMLAIMQVFAQFEGQKRTTTTGSDAQTNGAVALYTIERDVRMAGYGLNVPEALDCAIKRNFSGTNLEDLSLVPVTITNGENGLPDTINILASSKGSWSVPARITTNHPPEATNIFLNSTLGMAVNDLVVVYQPGKDCTLFQVTGIPNGNVQVHHQNTSPWNPPGGQNIFPKPDGYTVGAMLFNLGNMVDHTYSLDANSNLIFSEYQSATNTFSESPVASNIVNLQAQYGFDNRPGTLADARVVAWEDTMIDADGNGTIKDSGDIRRIYAVRMALVARSALKEKPKSDGTCDITTDDSANRPTWVGGAIDVSRNPDGSANNDWMCYRYKVFETVIPLRNLLWREP